MRQRLTGFFNRVFRRTANKGGAPRPAGGLEHHGLPDADLAGVHIEYEPNLDGDPDPGEVVWAWVSFEEDPDQGKDRPVVIIGRRGSLLVGVPLTTKRDDREPQVEVGTGDWDPQHRVSYARIWRLYDVDPHAMRREGAIVTPQTFVDIVKAVDRYYDVTMPKRKRRAG